MPAQLVALNDGPSILLDKPILLLGRHPECDIQIDSRKISRRHCCIAQVSDYLVVRDLGSTNGIRINGVRVNEGRLADGDELTLGSHRYRVRWDVPPGSPARKKSTFRAPVEAPDELLESCDEPIPLAEPDPVSPLPPASLDQQESLILPDNLELLPDSRVFPKVPSPSASGSHPPA